MRNSFYQLPDNHYHNSFFVWVHFGDGGKCSSVAKFKSGFPSQFQPNFFKKIKFLSVIDYFITFSMWWNIGILLTYTQEKRRDVLFVIPHQAVCSSMPHLSVTYFLKFSNITHLFKDQTWASLSWLLTQTCFPF